MINNINDIKELINKYNNVYKYGILENVLDKHYDEELAQDEINWKYKENLENEEHRWFVVGFNVYEFFKGKESLGFLAVKEVVTLKSELMDYKDCYVSVEAYNVIEIIKKSFEIIK